MQHASTGRCSSVIWLAVLVVHGGQVDDYLADICWSIYTGHDQRTRARHSKKSHSATSQSRNAKINNDRGSARETGAMLFGNITLQA